MKQTTEHNKCVTGNSWLIIIILIVLLLLIISGHLYKSALLCRRADGPAAAATGATATRGPDVAAVNRDVITPRRRGRRRQTIGDVNSVTCSAGHVTCCHLPDNKAVVVTRSRPTQPPPGAQQQPAVQLQQQDDKTMTRAKTGGAKMNADEDCRVVCLWTAIGLREIVTLLHRKSREIVAAGRRLLPGPLLHSQVHLSRLYALLPTHQSSRRTRTLKCSSFRVERQRQ